MAVDAAAQDDGVIAQYLFDRALRRQCPLVLIQRINAERAVLGIADIDHAFGLSRSGESGEEENQHAPDADRFEAALHFRPRSAMMLDVLFDDRGIVLRRIDRCKVFGRILDRGPE